MSRLLALALVAVFAPSSAGKTLQEQVLRVAQAAAPPYLDILYQTASQGTVEIDATVLPSGEVVDPRVTRKFWSEELERRFGLSDQFNNYARRWRFEPVQRNASVRFIFVFRLLQSDTPGEQVGVLFKHPTTVENSRYAPPLIKIH